MKKIKEVKEAKKMKEVKETKKSKEVNEAKKTKLVKEANKTKEVKKAKATKVGTEAKKSNKCEADVKETLKDFVEAKAVDLKRKIDEASPNRFMDETPKKKLRTPC